MTGDLVKAMRACPQPIIAAVDGVCTGAGAILAMASDLRFATPRAKTAFLFARVGLAGHPEGSPDIDAAGLAEALAHKNEWAAKTGLAVELMTQFCFDAGRVLAWERAIRESGNRLPIRIGLPGPASIKSLLRYAQMCGVGNSLAFLSKRAGNVLQLVTAAEPDGFVVDLAKAVAGDDANLIAGLHFYPFGGFYKTAAYAWRVSSGRFAMESDGQGFAVLA
jgi:methylenetetrahydrofolate reductase (NADPH)